MLRGDVVGDVDELSSVEAAWDALAERRALPYCSPAWMLAWWRKAAPERALLKVVVVRERDEVIGVAPFYALPSFGAVRYRLLASGASTRREPLCVAGREEEVGLIVVRALAGTSPRPDLVEFEGIPAGSPWPRIFERAWPAGGSPRVELDQEIPAPVLAFGGRSYDEWFAGKSSNFRQQMRKTRRDLEKKGATFRMSTAEDLRRDLKSFAELHYGRWAERGGSHGLNKGVEGMLLEAGEQLIASGRFRLWCTDVDGKTISSHLFLAAGGEVTYWLGGFAEEWSNAKPSLQTILAAIEHASAGGDARVDLGVGVQDYKLRFAEDEDVLQWRTIFPKGIRYPLTRAVLAPRRIGRRLVARLPHDRRARLKRLLKR